MRVVVATLLVLWSLFHGTGLLAWGTEQVQRVPLWGRLLWGALSLAGVAAAGLLVARSPLAVPVAAVAVAGTSALAVANGVWIHGRPTVRHHVVRAAVAAPLLALVVAAG